MKFRFFGDSWFWAWSPKYRFQSKSFIHKTHWQDALNLTEMLLNGFGHTVDCYCEPQKSFNKTAHEIFNLADFLQTGLSHNTSDSEVWIVWMSSDLRQPHPNDHINFPKFDFSDKDKFLEQYDNYVLKNLAKVFEAANLRPNAEILIFGGQQSFPRALFEKLQPAPNNIKLVSENILNDLMKTQIDSTVQEVPRFYEESSFMVRLDEWKVRNRGTKKIDINLMDYMIDHSKKGLDDRAEQFDLLTWPDTEHLGFSGHVFFVDYLLKYCENNNLLN